MSSAISDAPQPSNVTEVKAFVGLVNYYARCFPNSAQVYELITNAALALNAWHFNICPLGECGSLVWQISLHEIIIVQRCPFVKCVAHNNNVTYNCHTSNCARTNGLRLFVTCANSCAWTLSGMRVEWASSLILSFSISFTPLLADLGSDRLNCCCPSLLLLHSCDGRPFRA